MTDIELSAIQLPNGQTLIYTTSPNVVIVDIPRPPYEFSGVVDMAWVEAAHIVGRNYTTNEIESGWPLAMEPHRLACMQFPKDSSNRQSFFNTVLLAACKKGKLRCNAFERRDYGILSDGRQEPLRPWVDYAIAAQDFAAWLAQQDEKPSVHIAAWFKAVGVNTQPETAPAQNTATPATPPAALPAPVVENSASKVQSKARRDLLTPAIETAQKMCANSFDAPTVWAALVQMAQEEKRPLVGVTEDGIKWNDADDNTKFFSLKNLRDRLLRTARNKQQAP